MAIQTNVAGVRPTKGNFPPLHHGAIGLGTLFFLSHVIPLLILEPVVMLHPTLLFSARIFAMWRFLLSALLLGHLWGYLLACGSVLSLGTYALWRGHPSHRAKVVLVLVLFSVLWFMVAPYQPALTAVTEDLTLVPTQPILPLRGLKRAQAYGEVQPCNYTLLGWQSEALFYRSNCGGNTTVWRFHPETMNAAVKHRGELPEDLHGQPRSHQAVLDRFRNTFPVEPAEAERAVRSLHLQEDALYSPDGTWLAVVSRYIYGPEDVILTTTR